MIFICYCIPAKAEKFVAATEVGCFNPSVFAAYLQLFSPLMISKSPVEAFAIMAAMTMPILFYCAASSFFELLSRNVFATLLVI